MPRDEALTLKGIDVELEASGFYFTPLLFLGLFAGYSVCPFSENTGSIRPSWTGAQLLDSLAPLLPNLLAR